MLNTDRVRRSIERLQSVIADLHVFDVNTVTVRGDPRVDTLEIAVEDALVRAFKHDPDRIKRYSGARSLDNGPLSMVSQMSISRVRGFLQEGKMRSIALLNQAIKDLESDMEDAVADSAELKTVVQPFSRSYSNKIFIVHGHDDGSKETVARFLSKIDLIPIILHELPNKGRTIISKFRDESEDVGFALVLMTPDDQGSKTGSVSKPRARQNVVFELGFFIGALGPDRVTALVKGDVEQPSDFDGVVYLSLDRGDWKSDLGKELEAAGYTIDWNKVMRG